MWSTSVQKKLTSNKIPSLQTGLCVLSFRIGKDVVVIFLNFYAFLLKMCDLFAVALFTAIR